MKKGHCAHVSKASVPTGSWTHFALTYTYGKGASFRGYLNGILANSGAWYYGTGNDTPFFDPSHAVEAGRFGGCTSGSKYHFQGQMYQLVVYERGLAAGEVQALYQRKTALPCAVAQHKKEPVSLTVVDSQATGYATFQSHNQKVVSNQHGLFMTHIRTRNAAYTKQTWRLSRSIDGGKTFSTLQQEVIGTNPPALETDVYGDLYLMRQNYGVSSASTLYIYSHAKKFAAPTSHAIPQGNSGKYAMLYDAARKRLYYFSHGGRFYVISLFGKVSSNYPLITKGTKAGPQYPYLAMDEYGKIYAAWTTQQHGVYMYWSIHVIRSVDGGKSWQRLNGKALSTPVVCDDTGPADRVNLADELKYHSWLWSVLPKNGKVHMAYLAQRTPARQHYVRYDAKKGGEDRRVQPTFKGSKIALHNLSGYAVADPGSPNRLFWISRAKGTAEIGVLQSIDNGATWYDHALGTSGLKNIYSLGGARELTHDGRIIGSLTDVSNAKTPRVLFFSVKTRTAKDPGLCM